MAVTPNSVVTPQGVATATAICTAAKTSYNDAANAVRLLPAASVPNGALVKRIYAIPRASVTATQLQLYRSPDAGATMVLTDSEVMNLYNMAGSTKIPRVDFSYLGPDTPLRVAPGEELWCAIGVAQASGIAFHVEFEPF